MNRVSTGVTFVLLTALLAATPTILRSQEKQENAADKDKKPAEGPPPKEETSVTDHTIKLGGQTISYKATAQTILLKDDKSEPTALLYSTAYTRADVKDPGTRPVGRHRVPSIERPDATPSSSTISTDHTRAPVSR